MTIPFRDRRSAGEELGERLLALQGTHPYVLGIPPGGVPVAFEVARRLHGSLDVFLCRRLSPPGPDGPALGTIGSGGARLLDRDLIYQSHIPPLIVDEFTRIARVSLLHEEADYREGQPELEARGRTVVLVDDGSSGLDMLRRSAQLVRELEVERLVLAVPTLPRGWAAALGHIVDRIEYVLSPQFHDARRWYADFTTPTRGEIRALLALSRAEQAPPLAT